MRKNVGGPFKGAERGPPAEPTIEGTGTLVTAAAGNWILMTSSEPKVPPSSEPRKGTEETLSVSCMLISALL